MTVPVIVLSSLLYLLSHAAGLLTAADVQESNVSRRQTADLQQVIQEFIDLRTKFARQEQQLLALERQKHIQLTTTFDRSPDYNDHYYLASRTYFEHFEMAEDMCELYGGYLAEINDEAELNFLRSFLNNTSVYTYLVGAVRDDYNKTLWEFKHSGENVTFFDWEQTAYENGDDCMVISQSSNWQMRSSPCITGSASHNFICEVPNLIQE